jgi:hypothetical protein
MQPDKGSRPKAPGGLDLDRDPRWLLLQRIVTSRHFCHAPRLKAFLCFVTTAAIGDQLEDISELQIGIHVFGRRPDYNPSEDSVVRSQARLLRMKLSEFFASDGTDEPMILTIPKGAYTPVFEVRQPSVVSTPAAGRRWRLRHAVAVGLIVATAAIVWHFAGRRSSPDVPADGKALGLLWDRLFVKGQSTTIVVSDQAHGLVQELLGREISLPEYLSRTYTEEWDKRARSLGVPLDLPRRNYTMFDHVSTVARLAVLASHRGAHASVRHARDVTQRDFQHGNVILLSTRRANPWIELFEPKLNFRFSRGAESWNEIIVNRAPQAHEQPVYPRTREQMRSTYYAVIACIPNLNRSGQVMIVGGMTTGASEMAMEMITNERLLASVVSRLMGGGTAGELPAFELLVRTTSIEGRGVEPELVALRTWRE